MRCITPRCLTRIYGLILVLAWCGSVNAASPLQLSFVGARPVAPMMTSLTLTDSLPADPLNSWLNIHVDRGDTLAGLFRQVGLGPSQWHALIALGNVTQPLLNLHPGDTFRVKKTADGRLAALQFRLGPTRVLIARRSAAGINAHIKQLQTTTRQNLARGEVDASLAAALRQAEVPAQVANAFSHIYSTRKDLSKDIQAGDHFSLIYKAEFVGGKKIDTGPIIAASIRTDGQTYRVFRQTNAAGQAHYYDASGQPYAPNIERTPLNYSRVSSPFELRRKNPALGVVRPHTGVDLAAPRGTPVHAAGGGTVTFVGWLSGYGRLVKIAHGGGYSTRYAHLSGFAPGLDEGDHVNQDQTIAYVGQSGLATGYHLHFEIRKNGIPHNPLTMPLPDGTPLSGTILTAFTSRIQPLIARLSGRSPTATTLLASAAGFKACPETGAINAVLALAPGQIDTSQLSQVFCAIDS